MPHIRAQVVLQGASAIPEDRFINVWHFDNPGNVIAAADAIAPVLGNFYGTVEDTGPAGVGLASFLSAFVLRPFEIRFYDMTEPEPRVPEIRTRTLDAVSYPTGTAHFPEEVACVLSFHAGPPITGRRRGRVYIGPLNSNASNQPSGTTPVRVSSGLRNALANGAAYVASSGVGWSVYSPTAGTLSPVVAGHVDNAFDTQRRRGPDASARTLWPTP